MEARNPPFTQLEGALSSLSTDTKSVENKDLFLRQNPPAAPKSQKPLFPLIWNGGAYLFCLLGSLVRGRHAYLHGIEWAPCP